MALPPSSPRLPSPPPPAEIQIGPKSPATAGSGGSSSSLAQQKQEQEMEQTVLDANAKRRIHPGTRAADFAVGPPLVPLSELDSAFQLQEHLAALHYFHTARGTQPLTRETASLLAQAPPGTDRTLWLYELCRFLIAQCNSLIVGFLFDTPPCSAATCPEMRASEWQFLCAVHEQPKSCCAIDYCCHTLDWAANVVTNPKIFPSRFVFADAHDKNAAVKNLINVFRRLHRIFAHAWFQHRGVFWAVEGQTGLYVFFKTVSDLYDLLSAENYKLPPEAEGLVDTTAATYVPPAAPAAPVPPAVPVPPTVSASVPPAMTAAAAASAAANATESPLTDIPALIPVASIADRKSLSIENEHAHAVGHTNTRRHIRSSPSTGSAVTTVLEQDEDSLSSASGPALTAPVPPVPTMPTIPALAASLGVPPSSAPVVVGTTPASGADESGAAPAEQADAEAEATEAADEDDAPTVEHVKSVPAAAVPEPDEEEEGPVAQQPADVATETAEATLPSDDHATAADEDNAPSSSPPETDTTAEAAADVAADSGAAAPAREEPATAAPKVEEAVNEAEAKPKAEAEAEAESEAEDKVASETEAQKTTDDAPTTGEESSKADDDASTAADEGGSGPSLVTAPSDEAKESPAAESSGTEAAADTA